MADENTGNRNAQEATIAKALNLQDDGKAALANVSDDTINVLVDTVVSNMNESMDLNEKVKQIIECIELQNRPLDEVADCIHAFTGMKFEEAKEIYEDVLRERTTERSPLDRIYEKLG